jgi:hydrophobic/amphiphilic exporter-1 (mainly G- bacteria), HAE1 family
MFVEFFIRRPIFTIVLSLIVVLLGAIAIPSLPVAQYPQLALPQVSVQSVYTGASAEVVETAVTTPLEQQINGVEGMKYMSSTSSADGSSVITVTFDVDRPLDIAAVDVQNRVATATGRLPNEVKATGVVVSKNSSALMMAIGLYAEHGEYSDLFISNYADVYMRDALKRIRGVSDAVVFGERKYAMRLWLDPVRMASRGLTATDVLNALREQNVQIAAGQVGQPPITNGQTFQVGVRALGRFSTPDEFERMVLKTGTNGSLVLLRDVGRAEVGAENYLSNFRFNGHTGVGLGIFQLPTANALDVAKAVKEQLGVLAQSFPPGLKYDVAFDTTITVGESIDEVLLTLFEAIVLVILVIFVFLQTWRSTLIPAITIPVSLIGTFLFVKIFGFSINTLTLFGLTLATGLVVDDAIVVIENIERFIETRRIGAREAASGAMAEVASAVIATSIVLIAVFVPVALFPGTTGRLYKQFSLTIAFSIALSAFNALTLTPVLSALLLRHEERQRSAIFAGINSAITATTHFYRRTLERVMRAKTITIGLFALGLALTAFLYAWVPQGFVPDEDQGYLIVVIQGPPGSSLAFTEQTANKVKEIVQKQPEVENLFMPLGFSFTGNSSNKGLVFVTLKPLAQRPGEEHSVGAIVGRIAPQLLGIPDALIFAFPPAAIQGVGSFGGFQFELEDRGGNTADALSGVAWGLIGAASQRPELTRVYTAYTANDPQYLVDIDREQSKRLGVPLSQVADTLHVYMGSAYVNDFDFNNRSYRVYAQADEHFRREPKDIDQFYVRALDGRMFPLANLVNIRQVTAPQIISHYNLFRSAEIQGSPSPGFSSGQGLQAMEQLAKQNLPLGFGYEWSGASLEEIASGNASLLIFGLGLLFVFLVLSAQYESFALPLIIMMAVPLAVLGALLALLLRGIANDVFAQIGLVMLIGLASKNAILIVEFAEQRREHGLSVVEAAVDAAQTRLRPILMTSFAFILGVLPLVFASGAGKHSRQSLGTTVFGGMILSTFLNLYFVPVLYVLMQTARERTSRKGKATARGAVVDPASGGAHV